MHTFWSSTLFSTHTHTVACMVTVLLMSHSASADCATSGDVHSMCTAYLPNSFPDTVGRQGCCASECKGAASGKAALTVHPHKAHCALVLLTSCQLLLLVTMLLLLSSKAHMHTSASSMVGLHHGTHQVGDAADVQNRT